MKNQSGHQKATDMQAARRRLQRRNPHSRARAIPAASSSNGQNIPVFLLGLMVLVALVFAIMMLGNKALASDDRHAGYYYPVPSTNETYTSEVPTLSGVSRKSRVGFIVGLTDAQLKRGFAPGYHIFAKGSNAEKLIIVATGDGRYATIFQLRALMAAMTSMARTSPLFSQSGAAENLNFLDLCKLAGFSQVTISNGTDVAHQIMVK